MLSILIRQSTFQRAIAVKLVDAQEAAKALGISVNTLYAYVSRGLLQSHDGPQRSKRYRWDDIERLRQRKNRPEEAARSALDFGAPVIESRLCQIEDNQLRYRGQDACRLADEADLDEVASLLWWGDLKRPPGVVMPAPTPRPPFLGGTLTWLAGLQESDPAALDIRPESVANRGWTIFQGFLGALISPAPTLQSWVGKENAKLVKAALILCADHELNASAFAARIVASTGASPYAVVIAALAALSGPRHGGLTFQVEALFQEAQHSGIRETLTARLRRGEALPGFGHRLYPEGDPRASYLLARLPHLEEWRQAGRALIHEEPSIDLALVGLARHLNLPPGTAFQIFATGRCLGWIAHALEQYQEGRLLRPRARYVGP
jgi:citrate synthase